MNKNNKLIDVISDRISNNILNEVKKDIMLNDAYKKVSSLIHDFNETISSNTSARIINNKGLPDFRSDYFTIIYGIEKDDDDKSIKIVHEFKINTNDINLHDFNTINEIRDYCNLLLDKNNDLFALMKRCKSVYTLDNDNIYFNRSDKNNIDIIFKSLLSHKNVSAL